ncbi:hypothetical protein RF11_05590 [Thelohanellus kitauei]|uniref:Uncharacterized protein n=1 Tax=Thelohanellus kitauei TaxID=669202 RepID=A0A0C2MFM8_THEKT|nr:hypothetical protein RF11_05590 [Thelohanellus kitauei]
MIKSPVFRSFGRNLKKDECVVKSFGGNLAPLMGYVNIRIACGDIEIVSKIRAAISGICSNILGLDFIKTLKLDLNSIDRCNSIEIGSHESQKEALFKMFTQLFD